MQTFEEMAEFPRLHSCLCSKAAHNSNILLFLCKMCSREVIRLVLFFFFFFPFLSSCKQKGSCCILSGTAASAHAEEMEWATRLRLSFSSRISTGMAMGLERIS